MSPLANAQPLFAILSALIEARAGLHYGPEERDLLLERTAARGVEAGFDSLLDYYYFLRYDPGGAQELEKLIDALVVNETFFFRELEPLRVLVNRGIAPLVAKGLRPRVWSAACSTGEEPLTLAMLLADVNLLGRVDLIASDISTRVLDKARSGKFSRRSLRDVPEPRLAKRWISEAGNGLQVDPALLEAISWQRINLTEPASFPVPGSCDFVLCRNVLIYFSDQTAAQVIEGLAQGVASGGRALRGRLRVVASFRRDAGLRRDRTSLPVSKGPMTTPRVRVLIVDDSAFARKVLRLSLNSDPRIEVIGSAGDGLDALEKIDELRPDVVTLDLVMPGLDGIGVLRALSTLAARPRVVLVTISDEDSELTVEALQLGAIDLVKKPTALATDRLYEMSAELVARVIAAAGARPLVLPTESAQPAVARGAPAGTRVVVIGTSTGGPQALTHVLSRLPADFPVPIAIALHIPGEYTEALARRLSSVSALEVVEAKDGERCVRGSVMLARGGAHLTIQRDGEGFIARVSRQPSTMPYFPSVDLLFASAAEAFKSGVLGAVLTGMGEDGLVGAQAIVAAGGRVITEAESSCVVFGMPRAVKEAGLSMAEARIDAIADQLVRSL